MTNLEKILAVLEDDTDCITFRDLLSSYSAKVLEAEDNQLDSALGGYLPIEMWRDAADMWLVAMTWLGDEKKDPDGVRHSVTMVLEGDKSTVVTTMFLLHGINKMGKETLTTCRGEAAAQILSLLLSFKYQGYFKNENYPIQSH